MENNGFEQILSQIAHANGSSPEEVRTLLEQAMANAMENPAPEVQNMWASIPRKGDTLTLDDFMGHLIQQNLLLP